MLLYFTHYTSSHDLGLTSRLRCLGNNLNLFYFLVPVQSSSDFGRLLGAGRQLSLLSVGPSLLLMQFQRPAAARDFSAGVSFQCRLSCSVCTVPERSRIHEHPCACSDSQALSSIPLTKIWHALGQCSSSIPLTKIWYALGQCSSIPLNGQRYGTH